MIDLKTYITEGVFDEEDILDDIDKNVECHKWFKELSSSSYINGFNHLWNEIHQHNKEIRATKISSLDGLFFVVEKYRPYTDYYSHTTKCNEDWRLKIFQKHPSGGNLYTLYQVTGVVCENKILKLKAYNGAWYLQDIVPKKSKTNNIYARQIYHLSNDYEWVYKLMKMLYDELK